MREEQNTERAESSVSVCRGKKRRQTQAWLRDEREGLIEFKREEEKQSEMEETDIRE